MSPRAPEEIDVFSTPHNRMKELVLMYNDMVQDAYYTNNCFAPLLDSLKKGFHQFLYHEHIENQYIMCKLKEKLRAQQIYNSAVCNCHNDNRMSEMLSLLESGYTVPDSNLREKRHFMQRLRQNLEEFTNIFIPHMEEEEEVFQPLLMKYFTYEELKALKEVVLQQHSIAEKTDSAPEIVFKDQDDVGEKPPDDYCELAVKNALVVESLPADVLEHIFSFLNPLDLSSCAQVSRNWRETAYTPSLWRTFNPMEWFKGRWRRDSSELSDSDGELMCEDVVGEWRSWDEDADRDESNTSSDDTDWQYQSASFLSGLVSYLLPRVGLAVQEVILSSCDVLTNSVLSRILRLCPNVRHLDVSYTRVSDGAFKGLLRSGCPRPLLSLKLRGCTQITSWTLIKLARSIGTSLTCNNCNTNCRLSACHVRCRKLQKVCSVEDLAPQEKEAGVSSQAGAVPDQQSYTHIPIQHLDLSGCQQITDLGLRALVTSDSGLPELRYLDLSGCFAITGEALQEFVDRCPKLQPEMLFYCDNITDGPYPNEANGCQNSCSARRSCCRQQFE